MPPDADPPLTPCASAHASTWQWPLDNMTSNDPWYTGGPTRSAITYWCPDLREGMTY